LKQTPLDALAPEDGSQIDLLHIDIQGGESTLVPSSLKFLNDKVAFMLIGTHSRQIEGGLFDCLIEAGWVLEVERPAVIGVGRNIQTLVDGVQAWRNPRLLPDEMIDLAEPIGSLVVVEPRKQVKLNEQFSLLVKVSNRSTSDWSSTCSTPVRISYHWLGNRNEAVIFDGVRTDFSGGFLYAGTDITQSIQVVAPSKRGKYRLNVTVVQETVRWFADPAFRSATCDISVTE
jgi:hypothetical protein